MRKLLKRILVLIVAVFLLGGTAIGVSGYGMYRKALSEKSMFAMQEEIQGRDSYISLEELPEDYIDSVVAVEDKRFYHHVGIDLIAIGRALYNDIRAGALVEGGSTITQQLAKNQYFTQEKKLSRKAAELFMAVEMEKHFSKDEILELYVNSIYFGNGYYGVREASLGYYGKEPGTLTQEECMMLAGIPNAPSVYNPVDNPKLAQERLAQVKRLVNAL
jgi:monofunctional glycosyltransferase